MSSTLLSLSIVLDDFVLVKSKIHSILVDVNLFGMHHCDKSSQPTREDTQHICRPIVSGPVLRRIVRILLQTAFAQTTGRTSDLGRLTAHHTYDILPAVAVAVYGLPWRQGCIKSRSSFTERRSVRR